jgi:hypothetical protein
MKLVEAKKAVKRSSLALFLTLLLCFLGGCEGSHGDIVGKWQTRGDSKAMVWEFSKDSSVLMGSTRGKYTLGDSDRVKIQTPFGTSVYQIEVAGDQMTLRDPTGSKLEFTKLK